MARKRAVGRDHRAAEAPGNPQLRIGGIGESDSGFVVTRRGNPINGDRVRAHLWNFDGRHNDPDAATFPPDVDDPQRIVVGSLQIETVDSTFGTYERKSVIEDDGHVVWVEDDTIERY